MREVGFTVLSMSLSLIAVFLPLLMIGGIIGRFFSEFAITLSVAILISLFISITLTPMMCAYLLKPQASAAAHARFWPRAAGGAAAMRARWLGAEPRNLGTVAAARHRRADHLAVYRHPENLYARAGYRPSQRLYLRRSEHFVSGDARQAAGFHEHHQG